MQKSLSVWRVALVAVVAMFFTAGLTAQKGGKKRVPATIWAVVQTGDDLQVVEASTLKQLKKESDSDYKTALADWAQARKEAAKNKQKFSDPKPKKPVFKIVLAKAKTKEAAEAAKRKAIEKRDRSAGKKPGGGKKGGG